MRNMKDRSKQQFHDIVQQQCKIWYWRVDIIDFDHVVIDFFIPTQNRMISFVCVCFPLLLPFSLALYWDIQFRSFGAGYPQAAQRFFCKYHDRLPQRRHKPCDLALRLPKDCVPFVISAKSKVTITYYQFHSFINHSWRFVHLAKREWRKMM
jgi:hypothetical protein